MGRLWIGRETDFSFWIVLDRSGSFWIVLDRSGSRRLDGARLRLAMPSSNMVPYPVSVGDDFVVVERRDEDGALHLSFFRYGVERSE